MSATPFPKILDWLHATYPAEVQSAIQSQYFRRQEKKITHLLERASPDLGRMVDQNANEWLLFDAVLPIKKKKRKVVDLLQEKGAPRLSEDESEILTEFASGSLRPYLVASTTAGEGCWLRDIIAIDSAPYYIYDSALSRSASAGQVLGLRLVTDGNRLITSGCAYPLEREMVPLLAMDFCRRMQKQDIDPRQLLSEMIIQDWLGNIESHMMQGMKSVPANKQKPAVKKKARK